MGVCRSSVFKPCKTRWIAMKFSFDIYNPLTNYLNVFSNPLNLPLAFGICQEKPLRWKCCQRFIDHLVKI